MIPLVHFKYCLGRVIDILWLLWQAEQLILTALARSTSRDGTTPVPSVSSSPTQPTYNNGTTSPLAQSVSLGGSSANFAKKSYLGSYLGLGALSLTREKSSKSGDGERGRKDREEKEKEARARSSSPFRRFSFGSAAGEESSGRRGRSPSPGALRYTQSDVESDAGEGGVNMAPRRTAFKAKSRRSKRRAKKAAGLRESSAGAGTADATEEKEDAKVAGEPDVTSPALSVPGTPLPDTKESPAPTTSTVNEDSDSDSDESTSSWSSDSWSSGDIQFDDQTQLNTALNAAALQSAELQHAQQEEALEFDSDPLGEGVNVIQPEAPIFETTYMSRPSAANSRSGASKSATESKGEADSTANQGEGTRTRKKSLRHEALQLVTSRPHFAPNRCMMTLTQGNPDAFEREGRRYVVASDLSEESRYAVEWGIGTVLRDGDDMIVVNVQETESKRKRQSRIFHLPASLIYAL